MGGCSCGDIKECVVDAIFATFLCFSVSSNLPSPPPPIEQSSEPVLVTTDD